MSDSRDTPTLIQRMTWQIIVRVHKRAIDGSAAHAKVWFDRFGAAGIGSNECLLINVDDVIHDLRKRRATATEEQERSAAATPEQSGVPDDG